MPDFLTPRAYDPSGPGPQVQLDSRVERGDFRGQAPPPPAGPLRVVAWNLERGLHLDAQLAFLRRDPRCAQAGVFLFSEADRGCSRTQGRNVARELAQGLGCDYAFGVQYVELPRRTRRRANQCRWTCEHGNAILSRYPLANVRRLRHTRTAAWYHRHDEPRLGGCTSLAADVLLPGGPLRVYSVHFDSGLFQDDLRAAQAADLVEDARDHLGPVLIGGDMNAFRYKADLLLGTRLDPTTQLLLAAGYADAHAGLPLRRRNTTGRRYVVRGVIDLLFLREAQAQAAGVARAARGLSDHLPVWAELG